MKSSENLVERRINYSVAELEEMGIRIFSSNVNRLQDERLISTFKTHLLSGGKYQTPGKLVNAKECIKAGRVLYRSHKVGGKKTLRVADIKDFTPAELDDYNKGLCLVVFDGNHRYNAMLRAIELATSPEQIKMIKRNVFFNYEDIPESQLSEVFLEINTQINGIDNQDYVPYILKNHGGRSELYEFEYALDSCQRAKYTGEKDRCLFNYTGSLLICTGGMRPRAYNDKSSLFNLAKRGKEGMDLPSVCKSAEAFKEYILVPYLFEKNLGPLNKMDHGLIFKNNLRFMHRLLNIDTKASSNDIIAFTQFLTENSEEGRKFLRDYRLCRTIRGKDDHGGIYTSNMQRDTMLSVKWEEFLKTGYPVEDITNIENSFNSEVQSLKNKEDSYKRGNKGAYTANHKKLMAASKLSVVAMYIYLYERE